VWDVDGTLYLYAQERLWKDKKKTNALLPAVLAVTGESRDGKERGLFGGGTGAETKGGKKNRLQDSCVPTTASRNGGREGQGKQRQKAAKATWWGFEGLGVEMGGNVIVLLAERRVVRKEDGLSTEKGYKGKNDRAKKLTAARMRGKGWEGRGKR